MKFRGVVIAGAMVAISACGPMPEKQDGAEASGPPVKVSAGELSKAYQENEAKAQMAYGGKTLSVTGVVKDIDLDFSDQPVIKLKGSGDKYDMGVNASGKMTDVHVAGLSKEMAAKIEKGQKLTVQCSEVSEVMGSAQLASCSVQADAKP